MLDLGKTVYLETYKQLENREYSHWELSGALKSSELNELERPQ